ncbi:hypothetical protein HFO56_39415 [Rhizobium laguerreae]|uniref:hypothetical protein n=1 Tax=Rhizobium laguerreae TaxID=1076926 RepID=UPI001C8FB03F|nr:hypothetical protein [Rhizobium laguerreae]MBY3158371.1 hypothetical protein [Rhizobium laguerreae]
MTDKRFPGVDEFTSHRIRKDAQGDGSRSDFELTAEVRNLQEADPYEIAKSSSGDAPSDGEYLAAIQMQSAMTRARLDVLGDLHKGKSAEETEGFLTELGMRRTLKEQGDRDASYQIWAQPLTGVVAAGMLYPHRTELQIYCQWSPWLDSMTEKEEAALQDTVSRIFAHTATYSFSNPDRPHLNHSTLHYRGSYEDDLTAEEQEAWEASFNAIPEWLLRERGHWLLSISAGIDAGLWAPLVTLERRGKFMPVWSSCLDTALMAEGCLGQETERERRFEACPDWFQEIIANGWEYSIQDKAERNARSSAKGHQVLAPGR